MHKEERMRLTEKSHPLLLYDARLLLVFWQALRSLFSCHFLNCPCESVCGQEIRQTDHRYPPDVFCMCAVNAMIYVLPQEAFERRDNGIQIAVYRDRLSVHLDVIDTSMRRFDDSNTFALRVRRVDMQDLYTETFLTGKYSAVEKPAAQDSRSIVKI